MEKNKNENQKGNDVYILQKLDSRKVQLGELSNDAVSWERSRKLWE